MKKLLILSNLLWISIISFQACDTIKKVADDNLPGIMGTLNCSGCSTYEKVSGSTNQNAYGHTEGLSLATARAIANNYASTCQNLLNGNLRPGEQDARSVWFSLETLKEFIYNIEKTCCDSSCTDLQLGIRVYYAKYPRFDSTSFTSLANDPSKISIFNDLQDVRTAYSDRHTVFMVPTYNKVVNSDTLHFDFDPWHIGSCSNPTSLTSLSGSTRILSLSPDQQQWGKSIPEKTKGIKQRVVNASNALLQNHGNLYPPDNSSGNAF